MDEGQEARWKDDMSGRRFMPHDHTSDHITHKALCYYLLWESDGIHSNEGSQQYLSVICCI